MAITAEFIADFSQFSKEVTEMEKKLVEFQTTTTNTSTAIVGMSTATTTTAPKVETLGQTFRKFDGILGAMGISAGPITGFVTDIGGLAAGSAVGMGALGLAATAAAAGIGTFMLTRGILSKYFPELDGWIANTTAKWLGLGDVVAQSQGAINDVLAKASGIAMKAITDIEQARAIIQKWADDNRKAAQAHADALKAQAEAMETVWIAEQDHTRVLAAMNETVKFAAKDALELGVAQGVVATAYGLTASQIAAVVAWLKAEKEEAKLVEAEHQRVTAKVKAHYEAVKVIADELFGTNAIEKAQLWSEAVAKVGGTSKLTSTQLEELNTTMLAGIDALARSGQLTSAQADEFANLVVQAGLALEALRPVVTVTEDLAKAQWDYALATDQALAATIKQRDEAAKTTEAAKAGKAEGAGVGIGLISQTRGAGTDLFGRPTIAPGGLNPININIWQPLGTPEGIAAAVGGAISNTYRQGGNRVPV